MRLLCAALLAGIAVRAAEALKPEAGKHKPQEGVALGTRGRFGEHREIGRRHHGRAKKHHSKHDDQWPWSRKHRERAAETSTTAAPASPATAPEPDAAAPAQESAAPPQAQPSPEAPAEAKKEEPEAKKEEPAADAPELVASAIHPGLPTKPGCYMKMPSGCPKEPMRTQAWRHDTWAEVHRLSEEGCKRRAETWNKHCEAEDAKMLYINSTEPMSALQVEQEAKWPWWPFGKRHEKATSTEAAQPAADAADAAPSSEAPSAAVSEAQPPPAAEPRTAGDSEAPAAVVVPTDPGCYMRMPSGCPKQPMRTQVWRKDAWAEQNNVDEEGCKLRKITWDKFCETEDASMMYVPASHPEPMSALQLGNSWPWSRKNKKAPAAEEAPEKAPAAEEAQPPAAAEAEPATALEEFPSKPGCYMRMPSGCPNRPMKTMKWRHDTWAEQKELGEEACKQRKSTWDKYCGSTDAKIVFVPKQ